eukprot:4762892-Prymnesium_polylepis.1
MAALSALRTVNRRGLGLGRREFSGRQRRLEPSRRLLPAGGPLRGLHTCLRPPSLRREDRHGRLGQLRLGARAHPWPQRAAPRRL